jgi:CBS domain-containing protein
MQIRELMTKAPTCCSPDTTLDKIAKMMLEHDCGEVPVCDGTRLVGVVTDRDITVRAFTKGRNPLGLVAADIMTKKVLSVTENDNVDEALRLMEKFQVRRLPVTREGKIVGIVALPDLIATLSETKVTELLRAISRPPVTV